MGLIKTFIGSQFRSKVLTGGFSDLVPILKEYTYSYKMDTKSENHPVSTFDVNSDPINVFMSPKLAQSFGTVS